MDGLLEALSLKNLLAKPRTPCKSWAWTRTHWTRQDLCGLKLLTGANADIEQSANSLGRDPKALVDKAYRTGLVVPKPWLMFVYASRGRFSEPRQPKVQLLYPFIVEVRGEHADLLAVNSLVPLGLPPHVRADVCQEIMLALCEGKVTIPELQADKKMVSKFIRSVTKQNSEAGGYAISLDGNMRDGRSWYEVLPAPDEVDDEIDSDVVERKWMRVA